MKKIKAIHHFCLVALLLITIQCSTKKDDNTNLAVANQLFEAFNQHNWQKMASLYSENASFLDPSLGTEYVTLSREEIVAKYVELEKLFPDVHDQVVGLYPSDDKVIVEFISTGSISDSLKFKLPIVTVFTFKDGLIVKDATYYDQENP